MPSVLFVCVHNAGRSQMAEALLRHEAKLRGLNISSESAGTLGAGSLNPMAVQAMGELGISMESHHAKRLTQEMADGADIIVSMGCGVDADSCPAKFLLTEDWGLDDPAGQPLDRVREIRDQIRVKVQELADRLS